MNAYTPQDLTEGCLVSGTYYDEMTFTDRPVSHRAYWYLGSNAVRLTTAGDVHAEWRDGITVTDIKPAPKSQPLWADPAIPDDALIAFTHSDIGQLDVQTAAWFRNVPGDHYNWCTHVRRVWLLDDTEVAVKKADIAGIVQLHKTMPSTAFAAAFKLLRDLDGSTR